MDIPAVFSDDSKSAGNSSQTAKLDQSNFNMNQSMQSFDPLAGFDMNETEGKKREHLVVNDTVEASDNSAIGNFKTITEKRKNANNRPAPNLNLSTPQQSPAQPEPATDNQIVEKDTDFAIADPDKMDFIKTYTAPFDSIVERSTIAVQKILDSIDQTVRDHSNDIVIPDEALEFINEKPEDGKVGKFDEAQQIVRLVMSKANEAKDQSEQAAKEAAKIYDDIQQFKHDTETQIQSIKNRDEFGRAKDDINSHYAVTSPSNL